MISNNLKRDNYGSVVNTDVSGYKKYISERNEKLKIKEMEREISNLKKEMLELKSIINSIKDN